MTIAQMMKLVAYAAAACACVVPTTNGVIRGTPAEIVALERFLIPFA